MGDSMTRGEFVLIGAALGAGTALGLASGCARSAGDDDAQIETPSVSYGGGVSVGKRILVGYATRTGSTVEVAEAIGEELGKRGFSADVKPLREKPSTAGYDAVVLGSAVNGGAWLPEAVGFVEANSAALSRVPCAVFCVHIMNLGDEEKARARRLAYIDPVRRLVKPADEAFFAGVGPTAKDTSLIARWAFKAFGGGGEGDCRDWEKIRAWAQQLSV